MSSWRKQIFTRDNYTCRDCGVYGTELNAHHIKGLASLIIKYNIKSLEDAEKCTDLWNIDNGMTLCIKCHNKIKRSGLLLVQNI
jgi:5-methylcytosine-specific restriction endonuclease McrA